MIKIEGTKEDLKFEFKLAFTVWDMQEFGFDDDLCDLITKKIVALDKNPPPVR